MKALILDGTPEPNEAAIAAHAILVDELKKAGWETQTLTLREMKIAYCVGCFGCWTKNPGECLVNDDGRAFARTVINSDAMIHFTPISFGGYSSTLKTALDRIVPLIMPYFEKVNGEVHHRKRYDRYPKLMAFGMLPKADQEVEEAFARLVGRNAINAYSPVYGCGVLIRDWSPEQVRAKIRATLAQAEVTK